MEEMESYKQAFLSSDTYKLAIEENWSTFKETVKKVVNTNIPCKIRKPHND